MLIKILDLMFKLKFISIFLSAFANNLKGLYVRLDQFIRLATENYNIINIESDTILIV